MLYVKSKSKDILDDDKDLHRVVSDTLSRIATIAGRTLGPGGRSVLIEREGMPPLVTKDGVTVVKALGLPSASHNIVLDTCKEISLNTARDAGDGTTTAIVLANALFQQGQAFMASNPRYNPQRFARELQSCYQNEVIPFLKKTAKPVKTEDDLRAVALISANGDKEVANTVVEAFLAAGDDGTVLIQEDQGGSMRVETIDGYIATSGLRDIGSIGLAFINDRSAQQVRMDQGMIVLYDGIINDLSFPGFIQAAYESSEYCMGRPIVVMAHSFADGVIDRFLRTSKGGTTVLPVKIPKSTLANSRTHFLHDMAAYTGATAMDPASASSFVAENFGEFKTARVNTYECFIQCESESASIEARVSELKGLLDSVKSEHDRAHIRASIGKLTGGISTVFVGGITDAEIRERRDRVQDAVEAVRSAVAEGVVPGGCSMHLTLAEHLRRPGAPQAWQVLIDALQQPLELLLTNCGELELYSSVAKAIKDSATSGVPSKVFDADTHTMVNPFDVGIVEPSKVHRVAIGNAISVASLLVTLGGIVVSPRDYNMETQLELSRAAFKDALNMAPEGDE
jgi:chaperonin GroEL